MVYRIGIIVAGRFHAFEFARALSNAGHEVTVFTNYPKWAARKVGLVGPSIQSFWIHGVLQRMITVFMTMLGLAYPKKLMSGWFGEWAVNRLSKRKWDVLLTWSSVSEEILKSDRVQSKLKIVVRGSAHIRTQFNILEDEEKRVGQKLDKPFEWTVEREEREYALADKVRVISNFAYETFVEEGFPKEKLILNPSGLPLDTFKASDRVVERRIKRASENMVLKVLYVGAVSFRKGMFDLVAICNSVENNRFKFQLVGPVLKECQSFINQFPESVEILGAKSKQELKSFYEEADLFLFPSLEEGLPQVVAQAHANCLPILTTPAGEASGIVQNEKTGWVLPAKSPLPFIQKLNDCYENREQLIEMLHFIKDNLSSGRSWTQVAEEFEEEVREALV